MKASTVGVGAVLPTAIVGKTLDAAAHSDAMSTNGQPPWVREEVKRFATVQARAALAGVELVRLADGSLLASKWGMFKSFSDADEVDSWLGRVGGPKA